MKFETQRVNAELAVQGAAGEALAVGSELGSLVAVVQAAVHSEAVIGR